MYDVIYAGDAGSFKVCVRCENAKSVLAFYKKKRRDSISFKTTCKQCDSESAAKKYAATKGRPLTFMCISCGAEVTPETKFGRRKYCKQCAIIARKDAARAGYERNKEIVNERAKARQKANPEFTRRYHREYAERHKTRLAKQVRAKRDANPDQHRDYRRSWSAKRRAEDPKFRISSAVRAAIWRTVSLGSKADRRTFELLGYSPDELLAWLEKQFTPGMTMDNYGEWHIDHRVPLASFSYDTPDDPDFKAAWALTNLQPLWAEQNQEKSAKRLYLI